VTLVYRVPREFLAKYVSLAAKPDWERMRRWSPAGRTAAIAAGLCLLLAVGATLIAIGQVALVSLAIWAPAAAIYRADLFLLLRRQERRLSVPRELDRLSAQSCEQGRLAAQIKSGQPFFGDSAFYLVAVLTMVCAALFLYRAMVAGALSNVRWGFWHVPEGIALAAAGAITLAVPVQIHRKFCFSERLRLYLNEQAASLLRPLNAELAGATMAWAEREQRFAQLTASLGLPGPYPVAMGTLLASLDRRAGSLCSQSAALYRELREAGEAARNTLTELEAAEHAYRLVQAAAASAEPELSGGPEMLRAVLRRCRLRLDEPDVRELLERGDWPAYRVLARAVCEEIDRLPSLARAFESLTLPPPAGGPTAVVTESSRDRAYRILCLPPKANSADIQRAYRWLSTIWHPDRRLAANDGEMKAINWAYQYLRERRDG